MRLLLVGVLLILDLTAQAAVLYPPVPGTGSGGTNSTVAVAGAGINVQTNSPNSYTISIGTNFVVIAGANVTVVTNSGGSVISYTISASAGGGSLFGTNGVAGSTNAGVVRLEANLLGAGTITLTTNVGGSITITGASGAQTPLTQSVNAAGFQGTNYGGIVTSNLTVNGAGGSSNWIGGNTLVLGSTNTVIAPGSVLSGDVSGGTNQSFAIRTNNGNGLALVAGSPGTASTVYITNITAATTLASFTLSSTWASGFKLYASCSGGSDRVLTFPNGCTGAGLGTPPAVTVTNAKAAWFDVICIPGLSTNVFWSPVF